MVPIRENRSDIVGVIRSLSPATDLKDFIIAVVLIEQVSAVEGFANLLDKAVGTELPIHIPRTLASTHRLTPGIRITCMVRKADTHRVFVFPDHFSSSSA